MAYNYNCPNCDRKWPYKKPYVICPVCRITSLTSTLGEAMSDEAARFELKKIKFNAFYAQREAAREGPSPEEQGRAEAKAIIELDREFSRDRCAKCGITVDPIICEFREPVCGACWKVMDGEG